MFCYLRYLFSLQRKVLPMEVERPEPGLGGGRARPARDVPGHLMRMVMTNTNITKY